MHTLVMVWQWGVCVCVYCLPGLVWCRHWCSRLVKVSCSTLDCGHSSWAFPPFSTHKAPFHHTVSFVPTPLCPHTSRSHSLDIASCYCLSCSSLYLTPCSHFFNFSHFVFFYLLFPFPLFFSLHPLPESLCVCVCAGKHSSNTRLN